MEKYREWNQQNYQKSRMLCIGGPSACEQALLSALIPQINKSHEIRYYCRNYFESNVVHSAKSSIPRYGCALNADYEATGRAILINTLKRRLSGKPPTLEDTAQATFDSSDLKLNSFQYYPVYLGNEINGIWQQIKKKMGRITEHDITRIESTVAQDIQKVIEKAAGLAFTSNASHQSEEDTMAYDIVFDGFSVE